MSAEEKKQLVRYLLEEASAGNFNPIEAHRGLHMSIPRLRHHIENTSDREVTFPLQFVANDWIATVARQGHTPNASVLGLGTGYKRVVYDVLLFHRFEQDEIIQEYSQADVMSVMRQLGYDIPGAPPASHLSYPAPLHDSQRLTPEDATTLVRSVVENIVYSEGELDFLENHPAYKSIIPDLEMRKAMSPDAEVTFPLMFSDGEWVACRSYWKQSFVGEMFGIQADGQSIVFETLTLDRIKDGKIVDHREFPDIPSMMRQLATTGK